MADTTIPHFRAGSIIPLSLSLGDMNGLYIIYEYLTTTLGHDGVMVLKQKVEQRQPLNQLERSVLAISTIMNMCHQSGKDNGLIEMLPLDQVAHQIIDTLATTPAVQP